MKVTAKKTVEVTMELNTEEVEFLVTVLSCIGGCPWKSQRKIADRMSDALREQTGIKWLDTAAYAQLNAKTRAIVFEDN